MLVAGGTGGHILPALALSSELMSAGHEVTWLGRRTGMEAELVPAAGLAFETVPAARLPGRRVWRWPGWWFRFGRAVLRALAVFRRLEPDAVVAAGGYVSAAPLAAALLSRRPFFLLEQNRIPGRVTRLFGRWARRVFLGFPTVRPMRGRCEPVGNPLRGEIARNGREDDGRTVLVLGGSQGARALSLAAVDTAASLSSLNFIVVTGTRDHALVRSRVRSNNCRLVEFTDRPDELYRQATIAIARAGGMVLSELVAFGIPAILVPYPHATDKHQDANAHYLASGGAAITLDQHRLSGLTSLVRQLMDDRDRREEMSRAAREMARTDAAGTIAERMEACLAG